MRESENENKMIMRQDEMRRDDHDKTKRDEM